MIGGKGVGGTLVACQQLRHLDLELTKSPLKDGELARENDSTHTHCSAVLCKQRFALDRPSAFSIDEDCVVVEGVALRSDPTTPVHLKLWTPLGLQKTPEEEKEKLPRSLRSPTYSHPNIPYFEPRPDAPTKAEDPRFAKNCRFFPERFRQLSMRRELRILRTVKHPNIIKLLGVYLSNDRPGDADYFTSVEAMPLNDGARKARLKDRIGKLQKDLVDVLKHGWEHRPSEPCEEGDECEPTPEELRAQLDVLEQELKELEARRHEFSQTVTRNNFTTVAFAMEHTQRCLGDIHRKLSGSLRISVISQIIAAVQELHAANVCHRNLSPQSIRVNTREKTGSKDGELEHVEVKVSGLAHSRTISKLQHDHPTTHMTTGADMHNMKYLPVETCLIQSVEQLRPLDWKKVDYWSIGLIWAELFLSTIDSRGSMTGMFRKKLVNLAKHQNKFGDDPEQTLEEYLKGKYETEYAISLENSCILEALCGLGLHFHPTVGGSDYRLRKELEGMGALPFERKWLLEYMPSQPRAATLMHRLVDRLKSEIAHERAEAEAILCLLDLNPNNRRLPTPETMMHLGMCNNSKKVSMARSSEDRPPDGNLARSEQFAKDALTRLSDAGGLQAMLEAQAGVLMMEEDCFRRTVVIDDKGVWAEKVLAMGESENPRDVYSPMQSDARAQRLDTEAGRESKSDDLRTELWEAFMETNVQCPWCDFEGAPGDVGRHILDTQHGLVACRERMCYACGHHYPNDFDQCTGTCAKCGGGMVTCSMLEPEGDDVTAFVDAAMRLGYKSMVLSGMPWCEAPIDKRSRQVFADMVRHHSKLRHEVGKKVDVEYKCLGCPQEDGAGFVAASKGKLAHHFLTTLHCVQACDHMVCNDCGHHDTPDAFDAWVYRSGCGRCGSFNVRRCGTWLMHKSCISPLMKHILHEAAAQQKRLTSRFEVDTPNHHARRTGHAVSHVRTVSLTECEVRVQSGKLPLLWKARNSQPRSKLSYWCLEPSCCMVMDAWAKGTKHIESTNHLAPQCLVCGEHLRCFGKRQPDEHYRQTGHFGFKPGHAHRIKEDFVLGRTQLSTPHYECPVCKAVFIDGAHLGAHVEEAIHGREQGCARLKEMAPDERQRHVADILGDDYASPVCTDCGHTFGTYLELVDHFARSDHTNMTGFSFEPARFLATTLMAQEGAQALSVRVYCCPYPQCLALFSSQRYMEDHLQFMAARDGQHAIPVCSVCGEFVVCTDTKEAHEARCKNPHGLPRKWLEMVISPKHMCERTLRVGGNEAALRSIDHPETMAPTAGEQADVVVYQCPLAECCRVFHSAEHLARHLAKKEDHTQVATLDDYTGHGLVQCKAKGCTAALRVWDGEAAAHAAETGHDVNVPATMAGMSSLEDFRVAVPVAAAQSHFPYAFTRCTYCGLVVHRRDERHFVVSGSPCT